MMGKIVSILIGLLLIIAAPFILWNAESQKRGFEFESAVEVNTNSKTDGYVRFKGKPTLEQELKCPESENNCAYLKTTVSQFSAEEKELCTDKLNDNQKIVRTLQSRCDANGSNCKPCYIVSEESWKELSSENKFSRFTIGDYKIVSSNNAEFVGLIDIQRFVRTEKDSFGVEKVTNLNELPNPIVGDIRNSYSYLDADKDFVVAGVSKSGEVAAGGKTFVISNLSYPETLEHLQNKDSSSQTFLRIISAVVAVIGFVMVIGGIFSIPGDLLKLVPVLGGFIGEKVKSAGSAIGFVVGIIYWILIFLLIMIVKNVLLIIVLITTIVIIVGGILFITNKNKTIPNS